MRWFWINIILPIISLLLGEGVERSETDEERDFYKNGLNLIFLNRKVGFARNFFIEKVSCTFKNLFKTAHSMCLRKQALQSFWQQIQDLWLLGRNGTLTPSKKWKAKSNAEEILFGKDWKKPNLNNKTYNFFRKMQCNCILIKVLVQLFQKLTGVDRVHGYLIDESSIIN